MRRSDNKPDWGNQMLTDEEIAKVKATVEGAFTPFRCVAEVWDDKRRLRFKVFDLDDNNIIEVPEVAESTIRNEHLFRIIIDNARTVIQVKGFVLSPAPA